MIVLDEVSFPVCLFLGMNATQARCHHQLKYSFEQNTSVLDDIRLNPSLKMVQKLRQKWVTEEHGGVHDFSLAEAILKLHDKITCERTEHGFVAVLVTQFMLRAHAQLPSASEMVYCDTIGHVDRTNCTLTILVCNSPAGVMPLGVIITSSQVTHDYLRGKLT